MNLVTVKNKYQIVIPRQVRERAGIKIGDLLEAGVDKNGQVTLNPQSLVDREIAESLKDYQEGRYKGPFHSAKELARSLEHDLKKLKKLNKKSTHK